MCNATYHPIIIIDIHFRLCTNGHNHYEKILEAVSFVIFILINLLHNGQRQRLLKPEKTTVLRITAIQTFDIISTFKQESTATIASL